MKEDEQLALMVHEFRMVLQEKIMEQDTLHSKLNYIEIKLAKVKS